MATSVESQNREFKVKDPPGRSDPDVVIPAAVKAAAARADELHKQLYPASAAPAAEGAAKPNGSGEPGGTPHTDGQSTEVPPSAGTSPPAPASHGEVPAPSFEDDGSWEHKFKSMQGRYDRAQDTIRQMGEQITGLQNVLATMNSMPPAPSQISPREAQGEKFLTDEEIADYGEEFLDVVGKKAREIASVQVNTLQARINDLEQKLGYVGGTMANDARQKMMASLDHLQPGWREINQSQKFFEWLALPDEYSGAIRHNLLKAAWDRNDTARSLAFFKGFLAEEAAGTPPDTRQNGHLPPPPPAAALPPTGLGQGNDRPRLEDFAAPGRAKSAAEIPAEKPYISRAQIAKFYADSTAGKFRGNEAERVRLERMIFDAQAEGRIVN